MTGIKNLFAKPYILGPPKARPLASVGSNAPPINNQRRGRAYGDLSENIASPRFPQRTLPEPARADADVGRLCLSGIQKGLGDLRKIKRGRCPGSLRFSDVLLNAKQAA